MNDQWYYRSLGQEVGPVSSVTLGELIQTGVLKTGDHVRSNDGDWQSINVAICEQVGVHQGAALQQPGSRQSSEHHKHSAPHSSRELRAAISESQHYLHDRNVRRAQQEQDTRRSMPSIPVSHLSSVLRIPAALFEAVLALSRLAFEWLAGVIGPIVRSKWAWIGLGVLMLALLAFFIPDQILTRSETHKFLSQTVAELRRLRTGKASEQQWDAFTRQAELRLEQMIPRLERSAQADDPVSMEYLFLARDYLPRMLVDAREQQSEAEQKFDVHMDRVERVYGQTSSGSLQFTDWRVLSAILCSLLLLGNGIWRWRRS